ncbi:MULTISPECIES: hypothetical protein [Lysinibacillus]|nr:MULTISPECIES: hypothetical protein [Lysinibacillus]
MKIKPSADVTDFQGMNCAGTIQNLDALFICNESKAAAAATITPRRI